MSDTRYQFQPWHVKAWRQARHRPSAIISFAWYAFVWLITGLRPIRWNLDGDVRVELTRFETFKHIWDIQQAKAQYGMQWYFHIEELIDDLQSKMKTGSIE